MDKCIHGESQVFASNGSHIVWPVQAGQQLYMVVNTS